MFKIGARLAKPASLGRLVQLRDRHRRSFLRSPRIVDYNTSDPLHIGYRPLGVSPLICPTCRKSETRVVDSRDDETVVRRRRECLDPRCKHRFTTYERMEAPRLFVVKKDGRREQYNRDKIHGRPAQGVREAADLREPDGGGRRRSRARTLRARRKRGFVDAGRREADGSRSRSSIRSRTSASRASTGRSATSRASGKSWRRCLPSERLMTAPFASRSKRLA